MTSTADARTMIQTLLPEYPNHVQIQQPNNPYTSPLLANNSNVKKIRIFIPDQSEENARHDYDLALALLGQNRRNFDEDSIRFSMYGRNFVLEAFDTNNVPHRTWVVRAANGNINGIVCPVLSHPEAANYQLTFETPVKDAYKILVDLIKKNFSTSHLNVRRVFDSDDWVLDISADQTDKLLGLSEIDDVSVTFKRVENGTSSWMRHQNSIVIRGDTLNMNQQELNELKERIERQLGTVGHDVVSAVDLDYREIDGKFGLFANVYVYVRNNASRDALLRCDCFVIAKRKLYVKKTGEKFSNGTPVPVRRFTRGSSQAQQQPRQVQQQQQQQQQQQSISAEQTAINNNVSTRLNNIEVTMGSMTAKVDILVEDNKKNETCLVSIQTALNNISSRLGSRSPVDDLKERKRSRRSKGADSN